MRRVRTGGVAILAAATMVLATVSCEAEPSPQAMYRPEIVGVISAAESITGGHRVTLDDGRTLTLRTPYDHLYGNLGEGRLLMTDPSLSWTAIGFPELDCFVLSGRGRDVGDTLVLNTGLVLPLADSYEVGIANIQDHGGVQICLNADGEVLRLSL